MSETPGRLLSSLSDGDQQPASKKGGYMGAFFHLFDRNVKSNKKHSISKALPQPRKEFNEDKLPMAKLLLIADENRGGFPSPKKIAASKVLSDRGSNSKFAENEAQKRAPGVVARLMGLEAFPDKKLSKDEDMLKQIDSSELRPLQELLHHKQEPFVLPDELPEGHAENFRRQSLIEKFSVFVKKPLDKIHYKQSQVISDGVLFKKLHMQDPLISSSDMKSLQHTVLLAKHPAIEPSDKDSYLSPSPHLTPQQMQYIFNQNLSALKIHSKSNSPSEIPNISSNLSHQGGASLVEPHVLAGRQFRLSVVEASTGTTTALSKDSESDTDSIRTIESLECRKRVRHSHVNLASNATKLLKGQPMSKSWNGAEDASIRKSHPEHNLLETPRRRPFSPLSLKPLDSLPEIRPERKTSSHREVNSTKDHAKPSQPKAFSRRCSADKQDAKKEDRACSAAKKTLGIQVTNSNQVGATMSSSSKSQYIPSGDTKQLPALSGQDSLKRCKSGREGVPSPACSVKSSLIRSKSGKEGDGSLRLSMLHQEVKQQICIEETITIPEQMAKGSSEKLQHDTVHHTVQEADILIEKRRMLTNKKDFPAERPLPQEEELATSKTRLPAVNLKEKMPAAPTSMSSCHSSKQPNLSNFSGKKNASCSKHFAPGQLQRLPKRKQGSNADEAHKRIETSAVKSLSRRRVTPDPCVPSGKMSVGTKTRKIKAEPVRPEGRRPLVTTLEDRNHAQGKPVKNCNEKKISMDQNQKLPPKRQLAQKKVVKNGTPRSEVSNNRRLGKANVMKENLDAKSCKDIVSSAGTEITAMHRESPHSQHVQSSPLAFLKVLTKPEERLDDSCNFLDTKMQEPIENTKQGKVLEEISSNGFSEVGRTLESIESSRLTSLEDFVDCSKNNPPVTPNACNSIVPGQEVSILSSTELTEALDEINSNVEARHDPLHEQEGISSSEFNTSKGKDCLDESCQPSPVSVLDIPFQDESPKTLDESRRDEVSRNEELGNLHSQASLNSSAVPHLKARETATGSTTEDFIQSERIMEAILGISRIRHIDPCSLGIKEAIDMACAEDEVRYMDDILSGSEFLLEETDFVNWSTQGMPIEASVFETLETQDYTPADRENSEFSPSDDDDEGFISLLASKRSRGSFLQRKLLFDCFNEALKLKLRSLWSDDPLAGELFLKQRLSGKEQLVDELHRQTCQWRELAGSITDELVEKDMNSGFGKWTDVKREVTEVGSDVERLIFKTMMEEIIDEMIE
ncbi:hypothetical protein O6H91_Y401100 [Diphasiastrum complanatum]|nr:hypothetical protein O6H91_Y401100 [Diphasiastrum complanatum]KAJ7298807.1 hypothetical protein O6H91_Y401100 [Diphasiastrum complanatum]